MTLWTLVNKNLLIPTTNIYDNQTDFFTDFIELTWQRSNSFNNNVYGVNNGSVFIIDNHTVYSITNNVKSKFATIKCNNVNNFNYPFISFINKESQKEENKFIIDEEEEEEKEEDDLETRKIQDQLDELLQQAEDEYNRELFEMKKMEQELHAIKKKQEREKEEENEKKIRNVIVFFNDCKTWSKLNKEVKEDENFAVPINFEAKYLFIDELNNTNNELINRTLILNEDNLYSEPIDNIPNDIIEYSEKYKDISKKLHYKFSHEYEYLEDEI